MNLENGSDMFRKSPKPFFFSTLGKIYTEIDKTCGTRIALREVNDLEKV